MSDNQDTADESAVPPFPDGSQIVVNNRPEGLTIDIPPAGLRRGSKGLFFFAIFWNGFMTVFTTFSLFALTQGNGPKDGLWIMVAFLTLFWLIGVGLVVAAINMGIRRAAIAVARGRLLVIQTGLFGEKKHEWDADEIKDVCAGPSGMKVNDVDVLELQVHTLDGKKQGFLSGRRDDELYWLVATISERLRKPDAD